MNETLVNAELSAVNDPAYTDIPGRCEQFQREVVENAIPDEYNDMFLSTARLTGIGWQNDGRFVVTGPLEPGDLLYKTQSDGPDGHTGMYVGPVTDGPVQGSEMVCENSSTHIGRVNGAKGFRTVEQWGNIDVIVRLPDPAQVVTIILPSGAKLPGILKGGRDLIAVRTWAQALGFTCNYFPNGTINFDGAAFTGSLTDIGGHSYAAIRDLATAAGLSLGISADGLTVTLSK